MNMTEAEYSSVLEQLKLGGDIKGWMFEAVRLVLAPKLTYTPDFLVINSNNEIEFHEVKGFWRDDAKAKIKMANRMFPFVFKVVRKEKRRWVIEDMSQV